MGAYTEIVDFTFTANETSRTFSGLSITKDDFVKVVFNASLGTSNFCVFSIFPNTTAGVSGHNTLTNYHHQRLTGTGSTVEAVRSNTNRILALDNNSKATVFSYLKISENGKFNIFTNSPTADSAALRVNFEYTTSSNLTFNDPITSLTFTSNQTNGLGTGSRIQIYKLAAEKVADITVASNTTQVDISNLSIDKDSEYLLVSDVLSSANSSRQLFVNDDITLSNYYYQNIGGNGSSPFAGRGNLPYISFSLANERTLTYSHIKLSNIGAYTSQNYTIRNYGTSTHILENTFISSETENITSITKLNFRDNVAAGSRFTLYKLYE